MLTNDKESGMTYLRQSTATRNLILGLLIVSSLIVSFIGINRIFADEGVTDHSDEENVKKELTGRDGEHKANLLEGIKTKIQAALESGDITQEQADEKLEYLENLPKKGFGRGHKKLRMNPENIKAKIQAALESGDITQEQVDEKLEYLENLPKKGFGREHEKPHMNPENIKAKIRAALESGDITQEQADLIQNKLNTTIFQ
jgi:hypothetical protein